VLERLREGAREVTERMQDKAAEVDGLRRVLAVDEREGGFVGGVWGENGRWGNRREVGRQGGVRDGDAGEEGVDLEELISGYWCIIIEMKIINVFHPPFLWFHAMDWVGSKYMNIFFHLVEQL